MVPDEPLPEQHVLVELDDGDSRLVDVEKIRMLPSDYSRVGEITLIMNKEFDSINQYQYSRTLSSIKSEPPRTNKVSVNFGVVKS